MDAALRLVPTGNGHAEERVAGGSAPERRRNAAGSTGAVGTITIGSPLICFRSRAVLLRPIEAPSPVVNLGQGK